MLIDTKLKVYFAVLLTTLVSILLSIVITGILRGGLSSPSTMIPSIIVPLCVAPLVSFMGFSQALQINRLNKKLSSLLNHDSLTNVYSRSYFFEMAGKDPKVKAAVTLMLDADQFKNINDTYGHDVGDKALQHISELISEHCRKSDIVARLGGEEFAVYMPDTNISTAEVVAERIRAAIFERPLITENISIPLSISIGIASQNPMEEIGEVLKRADAALYQAKEDGRNRVRLDWRSAA